MSENRLFPDTSPNDIYKHIIEKLKELYPNLSIQLIEGSVRNLKEFKIWLEIKTLDYNSEI